MPRKRTNVDKITVTTHVERRVIDSFDKMYPSCRARFCENAIKIAVTDRKFFDNIFFRDIIANCDNGYL